jgi:hypothetical protein
VVVNGYFRVKDSKMLLDAKRLSQSIRFDPGKSRFQPLDNNQNACYTYIT